MNQLQAELYHYGIKGQKYGVRRFQNEDGSLTEAGRRRYSSAKIGQTESSEPKHSSGNSSAETGIKASSSSRGGKSSSGGKGKSSSKSSESGIKASSSGGKNSKFDVGPIREPISVTMKKNKEKNRKVVEAYIGGSSNASTTSYSSVSSSPTVSIGKRRVRALIGGG